jgi:hypothetical protein
MQSQTAFVLNVAMCYLMMGNKSVAAIMVTVITKNYDLYMEYPSSALVSYYVNCS